MLPAARQWFDVIDVETVPRHVASTHAAPAVIAVVHHEWVDVLYESVTQPGATAIARPATEGHAMPAVRATLHAEKQKRPRVQGPRRKLLPARTHSHEQQVRHEMVTVLKTCSMERPNFTPYASCRNSSVSFGGGSWSIPTVDPG